MNKDQKQYLENSIKSISINGRMYFALCCLKNAFESKGIKSEALNYILNIIIEFLQSTELDKWEEYAKAILPESILDTTFNIFDSIIEPDLILKLKSFYENLPQYLVGLIENTLNIGLDNLYSGTDEYSSITFDDVIKIINICEKNNIKIPDINNFIEYSFKENHGWGKDIKIDKINENDVRPYCT